MIKDYRIQGELEAMKAILAQAQKAFDDGNKEDLKVFINLIESAVNVTKYYIRLQEEKTA